MKYKAKKIFTNIRMIIVLVALLLAVFSMHPNPFVKGLTIRNVVANSSASIAGIENPKPTLPPMNKERIISINNIEMNSVLDYHNFENTLEPNRTIQLKTNKQFYRLTTKSKYNITILNETEIKQIKEIVQENVTINGTLTLINKTITKQIIVNKTKKTFIGTQSLGLSVYNAPTTNIRKGLDLQGGTRVLLTPEEKLSDNDMSILLDNMKYRLNIYGLSDLVVREASDLSDNQYILVEIAGANENEVKELLSKQGKFESKIGNTTVFRGGDDITYVCKSADCSGIDPNRGCGQFEGGYTCSFRFSIALSPDAAKKQADATDKLDIIIDPNNNNKYLSKKLQLYLDNALVDELNIGEDLKGRAVTDIQISGSGVGPTEQQAIYNTLENMKKLQTILITGSLPSKLEIVKTDNISPALGEEFIDSALLIGLLSILAVFVVIFARYKKLKIAIPILVTSLIEVTLLLGAASIIGWNLDLAAIAGIIIAVGTGIDHQIVITDETLKGKSQIYDWKKRIKNAFYIIMGSYFTTVVAMIPLMFAGAGLLKGFALTTIIGVSIGVFISRPAYAAVIEILLKD
jgi:preprotein translocase subunit SecD